MVLPAMSSLTQSILFFNLNLCRHFLLLSKSALRLVLLVSDEPRCWATIVQYLSPASPAPPLPPLCNPNSFQTNYGGSLRYLTVGPPHTFFSFPKRDLFGRFPIRVSLRLSAGAGFISCFLNLSRDAADNADSRPLAKCDPHGVRRL